MPLTLWRGDQLLGHLHLRSSSTAAQIEGVLLRHPNAPPPASVQQVCVSLHGIDVVHHLPWDADIVAERGRLPRTPPAHPAQVTLRPVPLDAPLGVPAVERLTLRDEERRPVALTHLLALEHKPLPANPDPELATFPPEAYVDGSVWFVSGRVESSAAAT